MNIGNQKVGWGEYFKPTPKNIQKIFDGLTAFSIFMTGYAVVMEVKWLAIMFIAIGGIGQFGQKVFGVND